MKCKYCNADIEQDSQFCPNCGKDLSKFNKCVKCGELIDNETAFCPNCGTEQPHEKVVEKTANTNKWLWAAICFVLFALVGGGVYYYTQGGLTNTSEDIQLDDSTNVAENDPNTSAMVDFIKGIYKDFYEPYNIERSEKKLLSKYFTEEAMQKFYVESDYDEGDFFYCTDFLVNGLISGNAEPDYGDKVVSRTIEPEDNDWFLVTNIWDVINKPVKVHLQVKSVDGVYKIVDVRVEEQEVISKTQVDNPGECYTLRGVKTLSLNQMKYIALNKLSVEDVDELAKQAGFKNVGKRSGFTDENCSHTFASGGYSLYPEIGGTEMKEGKDGFMFVVKCEDQKYTIACYTTMVEFFERLCTDIKDACPSVIDLVLDGYESGSMNGEIDGTKFRLDFEDSSGDKYGFMFFDF